MFSCLLTQGAQGSTHDRACGGNTPAGRHHLGDHRRPRRHHTDGPARIELPAHGAVIPDGRWRHCPLLCWLLALSDASARCAVGQRACRNRPDRGIRRCRRTVLYIAASFDLPLRDAWFDAADRALGLDWSALLNWMDAHANLHPLFRLIYLSLLPQTVIVVLALAQLMGMGRKASLPSPACTLRLPSSLRWACGRSRYFAGSQRRSIR